MSQISYGTITITDTNDIESIVVEYSRNQSTSSAPDSGWSTNRPAWAQGYYIWQRTRIHKSGTSEADDSFGNAVCITGSTGQTGAAGTSITITNTSVTYQVSSNGTTTPTGTWQNNVQATTTGQFLWTRTIVTYSDGNSTTSYSVAAHGSTGAAGSNGTSVSISSIKYAVSTTDSQPADSSFTYTSVPTVAEGSWLWTLTTYSNGSKMYTKSKQGKSGTNGTNGADGRSLTNTVTHFTVAATNITINESNMGNYTWTSNTPTYNSSKPVYWVRVTNTYSNPSSTEYIFYKDQGLSDANAIAAAANTTANDAAAAASSAITTANSAAAAASSAISAAASASALAGSKNTVYYANTSSALPSSVKNGDVWIQTQTSSSTQDGIAGSRIMYLYENNQWNQVKFGTSSLVAGTVVADLIAGNAITAGKIQVEDLISNGINSSNNTVKISAQKVDIEGAAIFTSGRLSTNSLNSAYDAKGAATSAASAALSSATEYTNTALNGYSTTSAMNSAISSALTAYPTTAAMNSAISGVNSNAVYRAQQIYQRKTTSDAPSKNLTWLSSSGTGYANWSLSVPSLVNGSTKYPYLYTATQTQTIAQYNSGSTCSCSSVLLDETTTVIDGGNIITGTITTNQISTDGIAANKIKLGGKMDVYQTLSSNTVGGNLGYISGISHYERNQYNISSAMQFESGDIDSNGNTITNTYSLRTNRFYAFPANCDIIGYFNGPVTGITIHQWNVVTSRFGQPQYTYKGPAAYNSETNIYTTGSDTTHIKCVVTTNVENLSSEDIYLWFILVTQDVVDPKIFNGIGLQNEKTRQIGGIEGVPSLRIVQASEDEIGFYEYLGKNQDNTWFNQYRATLKDGVFSTGFNTGVSFAPGRLYGELKNGTRLPWFVTLWENATPGASAGFASHNSSNPIITVLNLSLYDYILVEICYSNHEPTGPSDWSGVDTRRCTIFKNTSVSDVNSYDTHFMANLTWYSSSKIIAVYRSFWIVDGTKICCNTGTYTSTSSTTDSATYAIPTRIMGIMGEVKEV